LGVLGALGEDVDHAVDRVGAPQRATWTADDLDAVDVVQQGVLRVPIDAGVQRGVDRPPVDHHQQLVGEHIVEAARADRPLAGVGLGDLEVRREAQGLGYAGRSRPADVIAGHHLDGRGGAREPFRMPGDRGHLDVHQFFEAEALEGSQIILRGRRGGGRGRGGRWSGGWRDRWPGRRRGVFRVSLRHDEQGDRHPESAAPYGPRRGSRCAERKRSPPALRHHLTRRAD